MSAISLRCFLGALAVVAAAPAGPRAAEADVAVESGPLRKEWVGLELMPVSYATSQPPRVGYADQSFSALQPGFGGTIRLGRYRWQHGYVIPFMASLYVSDAAANTILAHTQVEGGVIVPGTDRRLELGAGLGLGVLAIPYGSGCDGSCDIGGSGPMASLAARFLFWTGPTVTAGVNTRAIIPLVKPMGGEGIFGVYTGHSGVLMAALELGFGRP